MVATKYWTAASIQVALKYLAASVSLATEILIKNVLKLSGLNILL